MATVPITAVIDATAQFYGVSTGDIVGKNKMRHLTNARHLTWWIGRHRLGRSYWQIARAFSRDHSTVLCGLRTLEAKMQCDAEMEHDAAKIFAAAVQLAQRRAEGGDVPASAVLLTEKLILLPLKPSQVRRHRASEPLARIEPDGFEPGTREWFFVNDERFKRGALKALRQGGQA